MEGIRQIAFRLHAARLHQIDALPFLAHHKPAAHRVIIFFRNHAAARIQGDKAHAVRMLRQCFATEKQHMFFFHAADRMRAVQQQLFGTANFRQARLDVVRVDVVRQISFQSQQYRLVAAMAFAGGAERAVQLNADGMHRIQQTGVVQMGSKSIGGNHRPHRMRTGWTDTDLE